MQGNNLPDKWPSKLADSIVKGKNGLLHLILIQDEQTITSYPFRLIALIKEIMRLEIDAKHLHSIAHPRDILRMDPELAAIIDLEHSARVLLAELLPNLKFGILGTSYDDIKDAQTQVRPEVSMQRLKDTVFTLQRSALARAYNLQPAGQKQYMDKYRDFSNMIEKFLLGSTEG